MSDSSLVTELRQIRFLLFVLVTLVAVDVAGPAVGLGITGAVALVLLVGS